MIDGYGHKKGGNPLDWKEWNSGKARRREGGNGFVLISCRCSPNKA